MGSGRACSSPMLPFSKPRRTPGERTHPTIYRCPGTTHLYEDSPCSIKSSAHTKSPRLTRSHRPVRPVTPTLARLVVEVFVIPVHAVKKRYRLSYFGVKGQIGFHLRGGFGMRTGCFSHRCVITAAALFPLSPPDRSWARQSQTSSASRAMFPAEERERFEASPCFIRTVRLRLRWERSPTRDPADVT